MKVEVTKEYHGTYLKRFLKKIISNISSYGDELYTNIFINNTLIPSDYKVQSGEILDIRIEGIKIKELEKLDFDEIKIIKESIVYEDENIVILNKKYGQMVHKSIKGEKAMVDILKSYYNNPNFAFANRLDRETSGLILGGKTLESVRLLNKLIMEKKIKKFYYALCHGVPDKNTFTVENYLKKGSRRSEIVSKDEGKIAITNFKLVQCGHRKCIVEGELITGRMHQIRVHLKSQNLPIVGDKKYSRDKEEELCLFSHRLVIESLNLDINLDIPKDFLKKLD